MSTEDIKLRIIRKLVKWRKWGGAHTEHVLSGLPRHVRGTKEAQKALKELVAAEWLLPAKKTGETHYSLNPKNAAAILQFYEKYNKN